MKSNASKTRPAFDVSLVICVHRASNFLARTMLSLEHAVKYAQADGWKIEVVFALDKPDVLTVEWLSHYDHGVFDGVQFLSLNNGSLGLTRNDGMRAARGEYIMFADDDDLISFNAISNSLMVIRAEGPQCIVIPQYVLSFGEKYVLAKYAGSDRVSPLAFIRYHPYVSRLFVHSSIKDAGAFLDLPRGGEYAFEDWHFNATMFARGYKFRPAPNTALFYRQRRDGLLYAAGVTSTQQPPHSVLFEPRNYVRVCRSSDFSLPDHTPSDLDLERVRHEFFANSYLLEAIKAAREIDPGIDLDRLLDAPVTPNTAGDLRLGRAYLRACERLIDRKFTDVVLAPSMASTREMDHVGDIFEALRGDQVGTLQVLVLSPDALARTPPRGFPTKTATLPLEHLEVDLSTVEIDTITLRLIESVASGARLHLLPGRFTHRFFAAFGKALKNNRKYYYRFSHTKNDASAFQFLSDAIDDLDAVLVQEESISDFDRMRLDRTPEKWRAVSARCLWPLEADEPVSRKILFWNGGALLEHPELLFQLARRLWIADPNIQVDVITEYTDVDYMNAVLRFPNLNLLKRLDNNRAVGVSNYAAIITEYHQNPHWTIAAGLAPAPVFLLKVACTSVKEVVENQSGISIRARSTDDLIVSLVDGILRLFNDLGWSARVRQSALSFIKKHHGSEAFKAMVAGAFE